MLETLLQRDFFRFWLGGLVSSCGDWMLIVALPLHALVLTGSALATGATLLATTAPRLVFGSLAGKLADRFDPRRIIVTCDLTRAVFVLGLLLVRSDDMLWLLYVLAFLQAAVTVAFDASRLTLVPRTVPDSSLVAATALTASAVNIARLVAPFLGGALMAGWGLAAVAVADTISFVVSAILTASIRPQRALTHATENSRLQALGVEGRGVLRLVTRDPALRALFLVAMVSTLKEGVLSVLSVVFAFSILGVGPAERGLIVSAQGIGGLLGGLMATRLERVVPAGRLVGLGLALNGLILLMLFNSGSYLLVLGLSALTGAPVMVAWIAHTALLQRATNEDRGRVFGALIAMTALVTLVSQALATALGDRIGIITLLSLAAGCEIMAGLLAFAWLKRGNHADAALQTRRGNP